MSKKELFDATTNENLKRYGIVVTAISGYFENSFYIINPRNTTLIDSLQLILVDLNIQRANIALSGKLLNLMGKKPYNKTEGLEQIVFSSYMPMFKYFYQQNGWGTIQIKNEKYKEEDEEDEDEDEDEEEDDEDEDEEEDDEDEEPEYRVYDFKQDGLVPFGSYPYGDGFYKPKLDSEIKFNMTDTVLKKKYRLIRKQSSLDFWVPTKKIDAPPATPSSHYY